LVKQHQTVGGIQISASHNPAEYNGLKLFSAEGRVLPADVGELVRQRYGETTLAPSTIDPPQPESIADTTSHHADLVEAIVDAERIRQRQFHVLLDANHGSGSVLGRVLLERLGCRVTHVGGEPDGRFAHAPEPTAENLVGVLKNVTECGAAIGFCQDPDADRLAIIDETGRYLGEEYTLALCVDHVLRQTPGAVVTNCSTSRMTEDLAAKYGMPFFRSAVGEANVVDQMLSTGAVLGGEGNGGVIDPRVVLVRDSFVGMALVLDAMAARDLPVSALADELPRYAIAKTKIELARNEIAPGLDKLAAYFNDATPDRLDGLRLDWADRWLLVRPSNTEPIVRAIAEAPTMAAAEGLCGAAAKTIADVT
jgi:phosphomannomutase